MQAVSVVGVAGWLVTLAGWPVTVGVVSQPGADAERYRCAVYTEHGLAGRGAHNWNSCFAGRVASCQDCIKVGVA